MTNEEQPQESPIPTDDNDQHDTTQSLADIAEKQLLDITEFLDKSGQEINRRKRLKNAFIIAISSLCIIAVFAFFWAMQLKKNIARTAHANQIATKAYLKLENDPTLAFRLGEAAYNIDPTPLAKQVIISAYGKMPFYQILKGHTSWVSDVKYSPDGEYILTASNDNTAILWDRNGKEITILRGHTSGVWSKSGAVNFSPDGKYIVTVSRDSTARLWDLNGNSLAVMKHKGPVNSAYFSPLQADLLNLNTSGKEKERDIKGYVILTASEDKTARLWDMQGIELQLFQNHEPLLRAVFFPDGSRIATMSNENVLNIWDLHDHIILKLIGHSKGLTDVAISPDGKYILTASWDKTARLWDLNGNNIAIFKGHLSADYIKEIDFSPDGKYILTVSEDNCVRVWNYRGNELHVLRGHSASIWSTEFSPDGKYILTCSNDATARLWNLNGTELMVLKGHTNQIVTAHFSPDGKYIITASSDQTARIWNIQSKENPILRGHTAEVTDANFSPNGEYIVTAGSDYTARLWNIGENIVTILKGHSFYGLSMANFSYDGNQIITTGGYDTPNARIWDLEGNVLMVLKGHGPSSGPPILAEFSQDSKYILTSSSNDNTARLWNKNGDSLQIFKDVSGANFSEDGNYIATLSTDSSLYIWQYTEKDSVHYKKTDSIRIPGTAFTSAEFSPNGNWLLTTSEDSTARIWNSPTPVQTQSVGKSVSADSTEAQPAKSPGANSKTSKVFKTSGVCALKHPAQLTLIRFSPNGEYFLTAAQDNIVRLFKTEEIIKNPKSQILNPKLLTGHTDAINDANFSKDSKYIVTGSNDFTVRVWDLDGNELQMLTSHKAAITKAKFSADGKYILSASNDHTAMLMPWRVEDVLHKINVEKVRGDVYELSEEEKEIYGIK